MMKKGNTKLGWFLAVDLALLLVALVMLGSLNRDIANATYLPSAIKSLQSGSCATTGTGLTCTVSITSVNTSSTVILPLGTLASRQAYIGLGDWRFTMELTNSSTVTCTRNTYDSGGLETGTCSFQVVEFQPSLVKSVQRGLISMGVNGSSFNTTISSVNTAKATIFACGIRDNGGTNSGSGAYGGIEGWLPSLTNSSTLNISAALGGSGVVSGSFCWQVLEFR